MDFSHIPQEGLIPPDGVIGAHGMLPVSSSGLVQSGQVEGLMTAPDGSVVPADSLLPQQEDEGHLEGVNDASFHNTSNLYQQEEFVEVKHTIVDGGDRFSPTACVFDHYQELLWMGNHGGHVTSYYGPEMQKYTSFQVHENAEVRALHSTEDNILVLFPDNLRGWSKEGRSQFIHSSTSLRNMQCMLETSPGTMLMGGHQPVLVEFDLATKTETRQVDIEDSGCAVMRLSQNFVCTGDPGGKVTLRDPNTLKTEHELQAHTGALSDFDVHGNQLITCGFANRMGTLHVDRFLTIYDLRVMRSMSPLPVHFDPMFLRFVPTFSNRICILSQSGEFQIMEQGAMTPASMVMYQVQNEGAAITAFDISSTCQSMGFADSGGYLHLFMSNEEEPAFNSYSKPTEFPHIDHHHTPISITDVLTPYSILPMMYPANGKLASNWPDDLGDKQYRKQHKIDSEILRSMKMVQNVGYAPNPGTRRRNQVNSSARGDGKSSSRERETSGNVPDSPLGRGEDPWIVVPKRYRKVEIKYSKLGVEDFDFKHYNQTNFAGLETHIPNAYCNAMLQMLYFIEPLRCDLLSHLCEKEFCLSCELGFLFYMLDKQKGKTCQASNFLRAFRTIPEASALGLVLNDAEESMGKVNLPRLIQNWSRFIMQQVHAELCGIDKTKSDVSFSSLDSISKDISVGDHGDEPQPESTETEMTESGVTGSEVTESGVTESESTDKENVAPVSGLPTPNIPDEPVDEGPYMPPPPPLSPENLGTERQASLDDMVKDDISPVDNSELSIPSVIKTLFGCELENIFKCRCGNIQSRKMTSSIIDLNYQEGTPREKAQIIPQYTFCHIVQRSMCQEQHTQAWCPKCDRYQPHVQSKDIKSLPDVLVLNCHLESVRDFEFWRAQEEYLRRRDETDSSVNSSVSGISYSSRTSLKMCRYGKGCTRKDCKFRHEGDFASESGLDLSKLNEEFPTNAWVPFGLKIKLTKEGKVEVVNVDNEEDLPEENDEDGVVYYELMGDVAHVQDLRTGGNLVSSIKVGETFHKRKEGVTCTQWYLFNDFSITPIEKYEAVHFSLDWKVPCVVFFQRIDLNKKHDEASEHSPIADHHLRIHQSLVRTPRKKKCTFTPLSEDEVPSAGSIVGLDAEFVTLNQEEAELRSDGTRATLKPSQLSVARVTCVRGWEPLIHEPFIDDYISTQEQVVDYLTQFSGIQPGDLDAAVSSKHLTTLKSAYIKLRYLVDAGVIFVGHGLKKDFRVINIVVPWEQILDTVELFRLPKHRMISLKFLAWYFLNEKIQTSTHDSTEDARTALKLYEKYMDMSSEADKWRSTLKEMYERGRCLQWKIPADEGETNTQPETTPIEAELQEIM